MTPDLRQAMDDPNAETPRERYFRAIAGRFISRRGAPFSLSPADVRLIEEWETSGIPLDAVLEGLDRAFDLRPGRGRVPGKVRALSFCRDAVERAFERRREREVGGARPEGGAKAPVRRKAARAAVEEFLARRPAGFEILLEEYRQALVLLAAESPDGDALERLDGRIDLALLDSAPAGDRAEAAAAVGRDHPGLGGPEMKAAAEVRLVKRIRERHRIPHVSPFYY